MSRDLVSLIIPVYNTASYLDQCLDSVLHQTYEELDVVIVDDGSIDESPKILEKYAARDGRVQLLRQENRGAGAARNRGMDAARGSWICFVDSDDHLNHLYVERLLETARAREADLALCCAVHYDTLTGIPCEDDYATRIPLPVRLDHSAFTTKDSSIKRQLVRLSLAPWGKLLHRRLAQGLRFPESVRRFEDNPFVFGALTRARRITYTREPLYYYRSRADSIMSRVRDGDHVAEVLRDLLEATRLTRRELACDRELSDCFEEFVSPLMRHYTALLKPRERRQLGVGETKARRLRTFMRRIITIGALFFPHGLVKLVHLARASAHNE